METIPYDILKSVTLNREAANLSLWLQPDPDRLVIAIHYFRSEKTRPDNVRRRWKCKGTIGLSYPLSDIPEKLPGWYRPKPSDKFLLRLNKAYAKLLNKFLNLVEHHELHADNPRYDE